jgi:hypothetical protein
MDTAVQVGGFVIAVAGWLCLVASGLLLLVALTLHPEDDAEFQDDPSEDDE